jgi:hypothetical protein
MPGPRVVSSRFTQLTSIHPKKLLLSKWTAVKPIAKQEHFLVTKVIFPDADAPPKASFGTATLLQTL